MKQFILATACLTALLSARVAVASASVAKDYTILPGNRLAGAPATRLLAASAPDREIAVVVGLKLRNQPELDQVLRQLQQPESPFYQRYLQADEFDERFGPTPSDVAAVVAYLAAHGLVVSDVSASGQLVTASGPVPAVEEAFGVTLVSVTVDGETHFAPDRDPVLPATLAEAVGSIQGLENHTRLAAKNTGPRIPPQGSAPFTPRDIAAAYNFTPLYDRGVHGDTSRGATVAIATAFGFRASDVTTFWRTVGIERPASLLEVIPVGGEAARTIDETTLDVEWAGAMAPAARVLVYVGADNYVSTFTRVYDRVVNDNRAAVVSISWGLCEGGMPQAYLDQTHAIFQKAAALGISVVAASGDSGAFECGAGTLGVSYPASDPLVTAVGGTTLQVDSRGRRSSERAWQGSGGGASSVWPAPAWQMSFHSRRQAADVALNADPGTGYYVVNDGVWWAYGGTSVGTPIWAALLALANQYRAQGGQAPVGPPAPAVCDAATQPPGDAPPLADITEGDNGYYPCAPGWDYPTGWGVPDAYALAGALAGAASPSMAGSVTLSTYLTPVAGVGGTVRLDLAVRCARTRLVINVRRLEPGLYRLAVDGTPVVEFGVPASGAARAQLSGVDPRGRAVVLLDTDGHTLWSGVFPAQPPPRIRLRAHLMPRGRSDGGFGLVTYRSSQGAQVVTVKVGGVPAGDYTLFVGGRLAAALRVVATAGGQTFGVVRFDSRNIAGPVPPTDFRCQPIQLRRNNTVVLELTATAPGSGLCPAT